MKNSPVSSSVLIADIKEKTKNTKSKKVRKTDLETSKQNLPSPN